MRLRSSDPAPADSQAAAPVAAATAEIVSIEPATGAVLWRGAVGDVDEAVGAARRAWPGWAAQPLATRVELVRRFANEARKDFEALATLIALETGKPLWDARAEVESVIARVEAAVRGYADRSAQRRHDNALQGNAAVRHKPHGVIAVITPFSAPAQMAAAQIVPALIAGNVVVFKPSEKAPATGELLVRCFHRAGIAGTQLQLLIGGRDTGEALVGHEGVDGVLFAGSHRSGLAIHRKLGDRPDRLAALQMGGNNPIVLWDTPKLTDAAAIIVQSAFSNAGQRCTAARRLIVRASLYDAAIEEVRRLTDRLIVDAPFADPAPFMGPVIDDQAADTLTQGVLDLLSHGGRAIKHLVRHDAAVPFLSPAIVDVTAIPDPGDGELYGPVLQVSRVEGFDEAIAAANHTRFGLVASLIGGGPQEYNRFWANMRFGVVNWNRPTTAAGEASPLGGLGFAGNHRPGGTYAADSAAYPVASAEAEQPRAMIGVGLSTGDRAA